MTVKTENREFLVGTVLMVFLGKTVLKERKVFLV
jgi:hypothetical protein